MEAQKKVVISYQEMSSANKLRDFSDEAGALSEGSFGANDIADARGEDAQVPIKNKSNELGTGTKPRDDDPLSALLVKASNQRVSKNKSHCGEPKQRSYTGD